MAAATLLYDADCGFCRWSMAKVLACDRSGRLRPVALQDPEADLLLGCMPLERRMASWHLVFGGEVYSGAAAVAPLMRLLPGGGALATLASRFPRATEWLYGRTAHSRGLLGRLVPTASVRRADRRIAERG